MSLSDGGVQATMPVAPTGMMNSGFGGYSRDGEWEADMRGTYGRGSSYRGRRRDAMGRYSRTDARDHMRAQLDDMMRDADDDKTREAIRRCMEQIERA